VLKKNESKPSALTRRKILRDAMVKLRTCTSQTHQELCITWAFSGTKETITQTESMSEL